MQMFTLRMQNIITILNLKALNVFVIDITFFIYMKVSSYMYINLHKSKGLPIVLNIHNTPK